MVQTPRQAENPRQGMTCNMHVTAARDLHRLQVLLAEPDLCSNYTTDKIAVIPAEAIYKEACPEP